MEIDVTDDLATVFLRYAILFQHFNEMFSEARPNSRSLIAIPR
jgi:hypothetical protein